MKRSIITTAAFVVLAVLAVPAVNYAAKPAPSSLTIAADHSLVKFGSTVTLSGKLAGANVSGRTVKVEQDVYPLTSFSAAGTATTNATGDWSLAVKPTANTRYRASSGKVDSKPIDVMVRPAIGLRLSDRTPARGHRVRFFGRFCPERDSATVELQRRTRTGWKTIAHPVLADIPGSACSKYSVKRRVRKSATYRTHWAGSTDLAAGNSPRRRARVH